MSHSTNVLTRLGALALVVPLVACGDDDSPTPSSDTGVNDTGVGDTGVDDSGASDTTPDDDAPMTPDTDASTPGDVTPDPDGDTSSGPDIDPDDDAGGPDATDATGPDAPDLDDGGGTDGGDVVDPGPPRFDPVPIPNGDFSIVAGTGPGWNRASWAPMPIFGTTTWRPALPEVGGVEVQFGGISFTLLFSASLGVLEAGDVWRASVDVERLASVTEGTTRAGLFVVATPGDDAPEFAASRASSERHPIAAATVVLDDGASDALATELVVHERFDGMPVRLALFVQSNGNAQYSMRFTNVVAERRNRPEPNPPRGFYDGDFGALVLDEGAYTDGVGGWRTPSLGTTGEGCNYMSVAHLAELLLPGGALVGTNVLELGSGPGASCFLAAPLGVPEGTTHVRASVRYTWRNGTTLAGGASLAISTAEALSATSNEGLFDTILVQTTRNTADTVIGTWETIEVCAELPEGENGALVLNVVSGSLGPQARRLVFDDVRVTPATDCPADE